MLLTSFFRTFESGLAIPRPTTDLSSFQAEMSSVTCNCNSYGTCPYDPPRSMPNFVLKSKSEKKRQLSKVDLGSMTKCSTESAQERFSSRFCCLDGKLVLWCDFCQSCPSPKSDRCRLSTVKWPPCQICRIICARLSTNICRARAAVLAEPPPKGRDRYEIGTHSA